MSYANNNNNNLYHHSISAKMCSNLPKENFNGNIRGGSAKNVNETPKTFNLLGNKEGYMSNKYNSFQPQNLNYNSSYQPNYFGEITFWYGVLAVFIVNDFSYWYVIFGAILINLL